MTIPLNILDVSPLEEKLDALNSILGKHGLLGNDEQASMKAMVVENARLGAWDSIDISSFPSMSRLSVKTVVIDSMVSLDEVHLFADLDATDVDYVALALELDVF